MTIVDSDSSKVILSIEDGEVVLANVESNSVFVSVAADATLGGSDVNRTYEYVHSQMSPNDVWVINHDLNKYCSVTIVDSGKNIVYGNVQYNSLSQITVTFESEFSGQAFLN